MAHKKRSALSRLIYRRKVAMASAAGTRKLEVRIAAEARAAAYGVAIREILREQARAT